MDLYRLTIEVRTRERESGFRPPGGIPSFSLRSEQRWRDGGRVSFLSLHSTAQRLSLFLQVSGCLVLPLILLPLPLISPPLHSVHLSLHFLSSHLRRL